MKGIRGHWRLHVAVVLAAGISLVVGLVIGLLLGRDVNANWFAAVGSWFGAIATLFTVVAAVLVFRSEQSQRLREAETQRLLAEAADLAAARLMIVNMKVGSSSGSDLLGVRLEVANGSSRVASHVRGGVVGRDFIDLNPPGPPGQIVELIIPPERSHYWILQSASPIQNALCDGHLVTTALQPWVTYQMGNKRWFRLGNAEPSPA